MGWKEDQKKFAENAQRAESEGLGMKAEASEPAGSVFAIQGQSVLLAGTNPERREITICCDSTSTGAVVYLRLAADGAESTEGVRLGPGQVWQSSRYLGPVCATSNNSVGVRATFSEV